MKIIEMRISSELVTMEEGFCCEVILYVRIK